MNPLERPHVWLPGDGHPSLLLLHGTGGDEHDLLDLGAALAPGAPRLSPRGTVLEHGSLRHFRRLREGVFDEDDLRLRADELAGFVVAAGDRHGVRPGSWYAVGFSNGANIATALQQAHPELLAGAALFAAMVPFGRPPAVDLSGKRVAISNGRRDPLATPELTARLVAQLRERGASVVELHHHGGHTVEGRVLTQAAEFLATAECPATPSDAPDGPARAREDNP